MDTQEQEKERLLGYLLNALDDHEAAQVKRELSRQPRLRSELAALQRELAPLNYIDDPVEPPPQLASRTCAKIWANFDNENGDSEDCDSENNDVGENPVSQDSVLGTIIDPFKTLLNIPAVSVKSGILAENNPAVLAEPKKHKPTSFFSTHWLGLTVSALVGIVVAFFLFPMIRYAERSTRSYLTDNWMTEINRRVDQYEQIYSNPNSIPEVGAIVPFNLALNGWQELHREAFTADSFMRSTPATSFEEVLAQIRKESLAGQKEQQPPLFPCFEGINEPIPLDASGLSDYLLISIPDQEYPVRSAFGQAILLKEGRVFFRTFPSTESLKQ